MSRQGKIGLRAIPSVDKVLREIGSTNLPRAAMLAVIRREIETIRSQSLDLTSDQIIGRIRKAAEDLWMTRIRPVINGTGVIIHTNLGRSPLGSEVVRTFSEIAANYNNLELDLTTGERGGRAAYLEHNLAILCGAEAATIVNNCAAALVLVLRHFTAGSRKQVIISRGELIQIGGGFRIPEILEASGASIREIGTTNKTSVADYRDAICEQTAMILKVHRSNFYMEGFIESANATQLAELSKKHSIPLVEDLGSGATYRTENFAAIDHEPTPAEILAAGVDLVCFSGDKLFGGPQAGVIAGNAQFVASLKREPFFRALRCDKLILSAMQTTVDLHLRAAEHSTLATVGIPITAMLAQTLDSLRLRARSIANALADFPGKIEIGQGESKVGGGTLPKAVVPSITLDVVPEKVGLEEFSAALRRAPVPVIGFISQGRFRIDLRTVLPRQDSELARAIRGALSARASGGLKSSAQP